MSKNVEVNNNSIGFTGLLLVAFIVLKLTKVIDWSWVWVLAPLWMPICIVLLFLFFGYLFIRLLR